jgi:hypothetical protein
MLVLEGVELTPGAIDGSTEGAWSTICECEPPNRSGYRRGTSRYDAIRETAYDSKWINKDQQYVGKKDTLVVFK